MSEAVKAVNKDTKYYIHSIIAIAIMICGRFVPVSYPFTQEGMMVLGVLIGAIYAFVNGNIFWASLLALLILGVSEITTVGAMFVSLMSNFSVMFLTFLFVFVGYLNSVGLSRVLALKIVQSDVTKGRPWVLTLFLLIAAFVPASIMSVSAVLVMTLPILYAICDEVGIKRTDKWAVLTAIAIGTSCALALFLWPFQVNLSILIGQLAAAGYTAGLPFVQFVLYMAIICALCISGMVLIIKLLKPDVSKLYNYAPPENKVKFNEEQKFAGGLVCLLLALFTIPQFLPRGSAVQIFFAQFSTLAIVAFVLLVGVFLRKDGKPRINLGEATKGLTMWPLIVMVGTVLVVSDLLTRADLGFVDFIILHATPIFEAGNALIFTMVVLAFALIITTFVQGGLVYAIMVPLVVPISMAMNFTVMQVIAPFVIVANIGLFFPSSHALAAILHAHESIGPKMVMRYVPFYMAICFAIALLVGVPLALVLF